MKCRRPPSGSDYTFEEIERDLDAFMAKLLAEMRPQLNSVVVDDGAVEYFARAKRD